ncbi:hypothetical protein BDQ17DRAFT_1331827 [Cyathus striatus]|nr:hypothetical protein BDQ17DRAFT_1331827 [Cyathus striatus]
MVKFAEGTNAIFEKSFSREFVMRVRELQETGQGESEEYKQLVMQFYNKHMCKLNPWPENALKSMMAVETNGNVQKTISPNDEVQEAAIIPYFLYTPKVKWVDFPTTTHCPMHEDPDRYFIINTLAHQAVSGSILLNPQADIRPIEWIREMPGSQQST